jgi:hypothetical protein
LTEPPDSAPPNSEPPFFAGEAIDASSGWQQEDELTQASKRLADFFSGRIVDLDGNETPIDEPPVPTQEPAAGSDPPVDADADLDDDIAF